MKVARSWWPSWLASCIVCGAVSGSVTYRRHGMCKRCDRVESRAGRAGVRRVEFNALRAGGTRADALRFMVVEIGKAVGVTDGAVMCGTLPTVFRSWADGSVDVPEPWKAKIVGAWVAVEAGNVPKVYQ